MLYQQLRFLAVIATVLVHLSTAANFDCGNNLGYVSCTVTLNSGNSFILDPNEGSDGWCCTHGGHYCAQITSQSDSQWSWTVNNNGDICSDGCTPVGYTGDCTNPFGHPCDATCNVDSC